MRRFTEGFALLVFSCVSGMPSFALAQGCIEYEDFLHVAGSVDTPDAAIDVAVAGNYAYVADRFSGLQVIDISAPRSPEIVGSVDTPGNAWGIAVAGSHAYVADRTGLQVIDISDPRAPRIVGSIETRDAYDVAVADDHAYIADVGAGLLVIDVSDPTAPRVVGSQYVRYALGVAVSGEWAFVADFGSGLQVIDVSDPTAPRLLGSVGTPDPEEGHLDVAVAGQHAYLTLGEPGLEIVDVSVPGSPKGVAWLRLPGTSRSVSVAGTQAYITNVVLPGVQVLDVSDPSSPQVLGTLSALQEALGVACSGSLACVATGSSGLEVIDSRNPRSSPIGSTAIPGTPYAVAVAGQYAYLATFSGRLRVVDISHPLSPQMVGVVDTHPGWSAYDVAAEGNYAYVTTGDSLRVIDISDPTMPQIVGSVGAPASVVTLAGNYAYIATRLENGWPIYVVDVSDPTVPRIVGSSGRPVVASDLAAAGNYVYVADQSSLWFGGSGLKIFDTSDPALLDLVGSVETSGIPEGVAVASGRAYVTVWGGLQVVDVSDPTSPRILGLVSTPSEAWGVAAAGDYVYVADNAWAHVIDASDPLSSRIVGSAYLPDGGPAYGVALTETHACIAGPSTLQIISRQCDTPTPVFLSCFTLMSIGEAVEIRWQVSDTAETDAFRLVAKTEHDSWEIPMPVENTTSYVVLDSSLKLRGASTVTYSLFYRDAEGPWAQLGQKTISLHDSVALTRLLDPYPNPFNARLNIPFTLDDSRNVRVTVYDASGREIARLWKGDAPRGFNQVAWEGRDSHGRQVGCGVYFVQLETSQGMQTRRLVLVK